MQRSTPQTGNFATLVLALMCSSVAAQDKTAVEQIAYEQAPVSTCENECSIACGHVDVEVGSKAPLIDGAGWVLGIPRKILLWDRRADNHDVSDQTVGEVAEYIDQRGLNDVKVRINQYDPGGEWKRLVANKRVGAGWRYTVGTITTLGYTILPGRLFGRDNYNPYTNTLSVYSDAPALALAEAAYAKDVHERQLPGTYATVQGLPLVSMWHETLATGEVLEYVAIRGSADDQQQMRRQLYARYGMELGGAISGVLPDGGTVFPVIGAASGHAVASVNQPEQTVTR